MRQTITIFLIALLLGSGITWWMIPPEVIDRTNYEQEKLDSLTTIIGNRQATNKSLKDSLEQTAESFREYVNEHQGQVATLTTVRGQLNTKIDALQDSLEAAQSDFDISFVCNETTPPDTTLEYARTFSNGLFEVTSFNRFSGDRFNDSLAVQRLRDFRIDLALLVSEDRRSVESIVTSEDFDSLSISAQTQIKPPDRKLPWTVFIAIGAGLVEVAKLIF